MQSNLAVCARLSAELIKAGWAFKSDVIIGKNITKTEYCSLEVGFSGKERETKTKKKEISKQLQ